MISVKFNKHFYSLAVIKKATKSYRDFARFKIRSTATYTEVILDGVSKEYSWIIKDEFSNYVLSLMKPYR